MSSGPSRGAAPPPITGGKNGPDRPSPRPVKAPAGMMTEATAPSSGLAAGLGAKDPAALAAVRARPPRSSPPASSISASDCGCELDCPSTGSLEPATRVDVDVRDGSARAGAQPLPRATAPAPALAWPTTARALPELPPVSEAAGAGSAPLDDEDRSTPPGAGGRDAVARAPSAGAIPSTVTTGSPARRVSRASAALRDDATAACTGSGRASRPAAPPVGAAGGLSARGPSTAATAVAAAGVGSLAPPPAPDASSRCRRSPPPSSPRAAATPSALSKDAAPLSPTPAAAASAPRGTRLPGSPRDGTAPSESPASPLTSCRMPAAPPLLQVASALPAAPAAEADLLPLPAASSLALG
mmetsp:Transcript_11255/g.43405  ORF Transcript_11255/g.43405 Transcript_11255/m.43405 type:complete len:356 (+) Transcript_11255:271-1338(+)